ncbi:hypothetical protein N7468_003876 [Penicillium chermesinum]|uniref:Zn(2)-C6 fungal-type domain-containing protein n=1 Tax=Penicillium chermesinum TaxID=63820 RepID=A0A9W9TS81_9EURO|nr:uncharacterized protein N7468_003876 [Penicillium chermesinum]KAJ5239257.1 hypothetical protein N7468_003876 [Penicillium chermesinum]
MASGSDLGITTSGLVPTCLLFRIIPVVTNDSTLWRLARDFLFQYGQPLPPAAKPGRKRQSCDLCFAAKAACDNKTPCTRCSSLGRECTFAAQPSQASSARSRLPKVPASLSVTVPQNVVKSESPFFFLGHFTNPSVKKDRLAIGETAKSSAPRNFESIHSHLEEALVPTDPMSGLLGDDGPDALSFPLLNSIEESLFSQLPPEELFPSKLSSQLTELVAELVETSKSMEIGDAEHQRPLDITELTALFGVSNISAFISVFFRTLHWHLPIVHFPTFDPGNLSNPLLLAIFLSGATYAAPFDGATLSPWISDVAEEYVFRKVLKLSAATSPKELACLLPTVQLIQGALIMEMLQFSRDDIQTRRRIRIMRHPCLVSTVRSLGFFQVKRSLVFDSVDEHRWLSLVAEEVRIRCVFASSSKVLKLMTTRIASWVFLADGFLTVCFKNHPALSIFEMDCPLPWSPELWEAEDFATFASLTSEGSMRSLQPPLKDVVSQLLEKPESDPPITWSSSLSPEDLLILIYGIPKVPNCLTYQYSNSTFSY